ncbi:MAG TPA: SusC/RagA family TonB-linked outer membrane protein [Tenuifilaceae bacterium]|nr:SusC/RagA family TonB-linked outer membrane protein [Bacteroidales bacterium]HOW21503.1 SusC/RagA family TonB-linked outer membrane protein [Tenuifilaceae bacterium]HRC94646.1 SusC/RagA family TonB-linked outer membrane protein [Tenuifilaceae bacterium]
MKKLCVFLAGLLLVGITMAQAQTVRITGTVTSSEDGMPMPGVSVIVPGTTIGASTNIDGKYEINVPTTAASLSFSFVGYATQVVAIAGRSVIDVVMKTEAIQMDEVVVAALGITREKKALGYAVQDVKGEELAQIRTQNVISSLSGRVAGVQITSASGQMGGGAKINVRGNTSLTKNNQPLFVVDGVPLDNSDFSYGATGSGGYDLGNLASDINSDDIESMTILKGASATALYGSRAANGVVMVTTKKGTASAGKTVGVSVNSSVTFEQAKYYPEYQKLYGGGYGDFYTINVNGQDYNYPDFATDESWGPKYDPNTMVLQWNSFDAWDTENYLVPKPWIYPKNDYTYFFETGVNYQNNVAVTAGNENSTLRISYTNMDVTGIYPKSTLKRNTVNMSATSKISKYLDGWINANYVQNEAVGRPETGYGDRNPVQKMWQWIHTSIDYKDLKAYKNPDGTQRTWNRTDWDNPVPAYTDNPYWSRYENYQNDRRDRVYGNFGVNLTFTPWLKLTGRMGTDFYRMFSEERMAIGSQAQSEYYQNVNSNIEVNSEVFLTFDKRFADDKFGLTALMGGNRLDRKSWRNGGITVGGLIQPKLYNLSNSLTKATVYDYVSWKRINSLYANFSFDYNRMVYLELTGRNDWSSTLPENNRSFFYPSATISFIVTELDALKNQDILSFAKVRGGVAQVGNDTGPYELLNYVTINSTFMDGELEQNPRMSFPTTLAPKNLKPELTTSWEIGTEMKFLKNRVGLDLSYFYKETEDQIIPIRVSGATGYNQMIINAGKMTNKGIELALSGTPISGDFRWDVVLNIATLKNKVNAIAPGLDYLTLGNGPFKVQSGAFVGYGYPVIYGTDYVKDKQGNIIVSTGGSYIPSEIKPLANVTPDFTAGLTNTFSYKGFEFSFLIDMQRGGNMYWLSYMWGMYSGILKESAKTNELGGNIRDDLADNGGVLLDGVYGSYNAVTGTITYLDADGNPSATPVKNTTRIDGQLWAESHYDGPDRQNVFKTDFIKLREVRLAYNVPAKFTGPIKGLKVSAFGRNLAIFGSDNEHFDPEYLQMAGSNAQGIEGGYLPSTMTFGFGLNFNF